MNAILGMAEIILTSGGLSDSQVRRVNDIRVSSENLLAIINDILDIAKLTSGSMPLVSVNFDFRTLVENVAALGANLAAVKGLHFAFNVEGEMPGYLLGDDVRIRQVLLNLIGNAVKFTSQGRVSLTVHIFDETLSFVVSDTGSGIKKEDLSKIFDPFTQAEYAKNRSIKGTGLGLYISKSLTERMNGRINVESEYGKGSVFTVVLPKRVGKETAPAPKPNVVPYDYDKSLKLLMVDDNEVNLHVVVELMGIWYGLTCDVAVSGHQALEKIAAEDYDIVFMDHMMSDMDGVETTALIRGMGGKYATLPIVAFTANAMSGAREMLLRSGMNAFISKPLLKNNMDEVLNAWVPEHLRVINPAGPDGESGQAQGEGAKDETASVLLRGAADIVGLNVAHGLDLAGGVAEVYEGTLRLLSGKLPQIGKALGKAGERGDFASLRIHAHSLKSSLALIGADELSGMARDLEDVAVTQDLERSREHLSALLRQLRSIGQDLAVLCKSSVKIQSKSAGNAADLSLDLQSLRAGLAAFRYDEVTTSLKKLEAFDYGPDVTAILASVKTCIETFDYEGALAQLGFDPDEM
ncbi:MAG: response regulator, partial [Desulfovibrio sp.]|jgi:CheY-like chemotaxis protein/HPt (histidine-containing phosphotransfer) domain-containing protein/anti-sigma regulatory factor (Ser/Thr protein kinase)|nr:response regulator [Desulfovibrio sp.]